MEPPMSKDVEVSNEEGGAPEPSGGGRNGGNGMGALIVTILSAVGSLYLATQSVLVTIIGAVVALLATVLHLVFGKK
jgi:hypothetical protein